MYNLFSSWRYLRELRSVLSRHDLDIGLTPWPTAALSEIPRFVCIHHSFPIVSYKQIMIRKDQLMRTYLPRWWRLEAHPRRFVA